MTAQERGAPRSAGVREQGRLVPPDTALVLADLGIGPGPSSGRWADLDRETLTGLVELRGQAPDEVDAATSTEHLWLPDPTGPVAYARLVRAGGSACRLEQVCSREDVRQLGLTSVLVVDVLTRYAAGPLLVQAPHDLVDFLLRNGFELAPPGPADPQGATVAMCRAPEAPWR